MVHLSKLSFVIDLHVNISLFYYAYLLGFVVQAAKNLQPISLYNRSISSILVDDVSFIVFLTGITPISKFSFITNCMAKVL